MKTNELLDIVNNRITECLNILDNRAKQYSFKDDRLHNFTEGAKTVGLTPEFYGLCLMNKQLTSLIDIIKQRQAYESELFSEKLNDVHNYLYLIEAIMSVKHKTTISDENEIIQKGFKSPEPMVLVGCEIW